MSTHNIGFYEEMTKIIFQLSSNTYFICSSGVYQEGLSCLPFPLYLLEAFLFCKPKLYKFSGNYSNIFMVSKIKNF